MQAKPVLSVDIDRIVSLWGLDPDARPAGALHNVDGVTHFLSSGAEMHLLELDERFEPVCCSGCEERAVEYLPRMLALPRGGPFLSFARNPGRANRHRRLAAGGPAAAHADAPHACSDATATGRRAP